MFSNNFHSAKYIYTFLNINLFYYSNADIDKLDAEIKRLEKSLNSLRVGNSNNGDSVKDLYILILMGLLQFSF